MDGPRRLPRNVWVAGFVSLFNDVSSEMVYPLLPLFVTGVLKASAASLGLIEGVAEASASLFKVYSGIWSDRARNRRLPMFLGYGFSLAARPFLAAAWSWPAVLGARFLDRVGKGVRTAPRDAVIAESAPAELRGKAFGVHRAMDTAGAALGPAVATLLLARAWDLRSIFWVSILPGLAALLCIGFIREQRPGSLTGTPRPSLRAELARGGPYGDFLLVTALFTLANSSDTFILLRASRCGLSLGSVTGAYLAFNLLYAAVSGPVGVVSDLWGHRNITLASFFYYALLYAGLAMASSPWHVVVLLLLYGPFQAVEEGVKKAYLAGLLPAERMGSGMGVYNAVRGVALLPASVFMGLVWDRLGPGPAFAADAAIAFAAGLAFTATIAYRRKGR